MIVLSGCASSGCDGKSRKPDSETPAPPPGGDTDIPEDGGAAMPPEPRMPVWARTARIGGLYLHQHLSEQEIDALLRERQAQNVSVIELDTRLSEYMSDSAFDAEVAFLDRIARKAHALDMRVVAYYPGLEVITKGGEDVDASMYKDHPDWVQRGITGEPNVFYGGQESWVLPGDESAWMSPNSPYRDYFLQRVRKLAGTALDGVWVDATLYLETGADWAGAEPPAQEAFQRWARARRLGGVPGLRFPVARDLGDPAFRAWLQWRHENIADFVEDVRQVAHEVDPDFLVVIENSPIDHLGTTTTGSDGTVRRSGENFIRVWEVDSVSYGLGMAWASAEDFTSKIAMYKWAAAAEHENLPWSFVYGNEPLDAGLVMAAAVAARNLPFECKTPEMTETVGHDFRARWFGFIRDHEQALFGPRRLATVGVWYSAATRNYHDLALGGAFGMYITTEPPNGDADWWATVPEDSAMTKPHHGGWRGAAHALSRLQVPFRAITDPGQPAADLAGVSLLWLPSVVAMSDESAAQIRDFVARGGTLLATGGIPATRDEMGHARPASALADVLGLGPGGSRGSGAHAFGDGLALYHPELAARDVFGRVGGGGGAARADKAMQAIESIVRANTPDLIRIDDGPAGIHVELSERQDGHQYLYIVNYSGLQQPLVAASADLGLRYRAPEGWHPVSAEVAAPDHDGQRGAARLTALNDGWYRVELRVDQLAVIDVTLTRAD